MHIPAASVEDYFENLPPDRKDAMMRLRSVILANLPEGFEEQLSYGMPGYVVPHSRYPAGYHCDPKLPLPFLSMASQKNFIALYHMGLYADEELLGWFTSEYAKRVPTKLDMGKSCIRFKKMQHVPYHLIGELVAKVSVADWIATYERAVKR
jgi:uncharacterized protein YdhG (YjbR/CyaY superfamily)